MEDRSAIAARALRAVSPELALVDPLLAAEERSRLTGPPVLAPATHVPPFAAAPAVQPAQLARTQAPAPAPAVRLASAQVARLARVARDVASRGQRLRRPHRVAAVVVACVVVGVLLVDLRSGADGVPMVEPQATSTPAPVSTPPTATPQPRPRRFAWAPVAAAESYAFELFRASDLVYSASSPGPSLTVPARWTAGGQARALTPGEYRWYVWPVVSGSRSATAVVQARLTVS